MNNRGLYKYVIGFRLQNGNISYNLISFNKAYRKNVIELVIQNGIQEINDTYKEFSQYIEGKTKDYLKYYFEIKDISYLMDSTVDTFSNDKKNLTIIEREVK